MQSNQINLGYNTVGFAYTLQRHYTGSSCLCSTGLGAISDVQLWKTLKPLLDIEKIKKKKVSNLFNFRGAPMVTTFVRSASTRTQGVWKFLKKSSQTDIGVGRAELVHSYLK